MAAEIAISRLGRHFSGRDTVRAGAAPPAVADNTLTIKQKSTLPVSKTRQGKSLFRSLSDIYLPPFRVSERLAASDFRRICSAATSPSRTSATPAPLLSPPASACALHPFYMTTCAAATAACGPCAKVDLAYTTGPFPVPRCPAGASRTTGALILYGAVWAAVIGPPRAHR